MTHPDLDQREGGVGRAGRLWGRRPCRPERRQTNKQTTAAAVGQLQRIRGPDRRTSKAWPGQLRRCDINRPAPVGNYSALVDVDVSVQDRERIRPTSIPAHRAAPVVVVLPVAAAERPVSCRTGGRQANFDVRRSWSSVSAAVGQLQPPLFACLSLRAAWSAAPQPPGPADPPLPLVEVGVGQTGASVQSAGRNLICAGSNLMAAGPLTAGQIRCARPSTCGGPRNNHCGE